MISLVVATRNRAHTLRLVADSFFSQPGVSEILFINDQGEDETPEVVQAVARRCPHVRCQVIYNPTRLGQPKSRNVGAELARNDFVLFCDDDEYLGAGYAQTCLDKLRALGAAAVSGRLIYMQDGETPQKALNRFANGTRRAKPLNRTICEVVHAARFTGELKVPLTNAVLLTRKALLQRFPFDPYYARGNGYREDTDYQMNLFVNGYDIYVTNDCHAIHLPRSQVRTGGQRVRRFDRIYWSIYFTRYFFDKYYDRYAVRIRLSVPKSAALALFAASVVYRELLYPPVYRVALMLTRRLGRRFDDAIPQGQRAPPPSP